MVCERYFSHFTFLRKSCKCQMIQNQTTSKSIIMEFFLAGFSNVTKCSATHVWYSFSLATFSVSVYGCIILPSIFITYIPSWMEVWPFMLFIILNNNCCFYEQLFCNKHCAMARVYETLK